jgi:hypothetical protein
MTSTPGIDAVVQKLNHLAPKPERASTRAEDYSVSMVEFRKKQKDITGKRVDVPQINVPKSIKEKQDLKSTMTKKVLRGRQAYHHSSLSPRADDVSSPWHN